MIGNMLMNWYLVIENSIEHKNAVSSWLFCQNDNYRVDKSLLNHIKTETTYWIDVLKRVVAVVKFLCERSLSFRGDSEVFGVPNNGNFLRTYISI